MQLNELRLQSTEKRSWTISKRWPRVIPLRAKTNVSSGYILHLLWNIFQNLITSTLCNLPSTENKLRSFNLWEYVRFSKLSILFVHLLCTFTSNFMSDIYPKFHTHELNSNKSLMWIIYRLNMKSLKEQNVQFSKFTDIPELFPPMDLMGPWNFNSISTYISESLH